MYLLDTDHISILDRGGVSAQPLLAHQATLLTRNLKDFGQIQNLHAEDWTI